MYGGNISDGRFQVHLNFHALPTATETDAFDRSDVDVISSPGQRHMAVGNDQIVGRIKAQPTGSRAASGNENGDPCMRGLSALHVWTRAHVTADVSRCKA